MRVLIVHYHLKPGGVSTVIRRQASALKARGFDVRILVGEATGTATDPGSGTGTAEVAGFPVVIEPALAYDQDGQASQVAGAEDPRIDSIVAAVQAVLGQPSDDAVIHVHNPTIRKNSACLPALSILAAKGYALVCHVHDLAEDWRPDVYCPGEYPQPATWACINKRDVRNLKAAGAGEVYFLPNAAFSGEAGEASLGGRCPDAGSPDIGGFDVGGSADDLSGQAAESSGQAAEPSGDLILYPVRGIRRKNLGEALLLSLYLPGGLSLGLTLPPTSLRDLPYYNGWKAAAVAFNAPLRFELGLAADFDGLYRKARAVVSTSIKEGFGLSFLEPLSRGKAVLGRRLPGVINDFEESGLQFPGLYTRITVPEGFFDFDTFLYRAQRVVMAAAEVYGLEGSTLAETITRSLVSNPDFGRLDETAQAETLSRLAVDPGARAVFLAANPFLETWWEPRGAAVAPGALEPWSEASYATRLEELYQIVKDKGGGAPPDKTALLTAYLKPEGYHGVGV
jgi:glycosyltransferase involved in cell wall biosynthesis